MEADNLQRINNALKMYDGLVEKIKVLYLKSEDYLITDKLELDDILRDAKSYMIVVFNSIINASNGISEVEKAFLDKVTGDNEVIDAYSELMIHSTFSEVPKYIKLACDVDKLAETNFSHDLVRETLGICKAIMDIDGNTYADESSFTYSFVDMLEKYIKGK